jgi:hypothetical protein
MPTCFVIMGFGEKNDLATGRKLNLDATYKHIIKPAVEGAKYTCIRADEVRHSGVIDIPMYDLLYRAELVIADLSTANLNAIFELGIRHALKPRSTIIIAEDQFSSPFDINHILIRKYKHLGTDIGYEEVQRMRKVLKETIKAIAQNTIPDSPVYCLLADLVPPSWRQKSDTQHQAVQESGKASALLTVPRADSYAAQWERAMTAKANGNFEQVRQILHEIYDAQSHSGEQEEARTPRPRVIQELALATYKAGEQAAKVADDPAKALKGHGEAIELLQKLDPDSTTDPETLGLWAAVHKRLAEIESRTEDQRSSDLDIAIHASERGFLIRQDYYTGTNLAYLLDYRASRSSGEDRIADRVLAKRTRLKVCDLAEAQLLVLKKDLASPTAVKTDQYRDELYWLLATIAEARIALADPGGEAALAQAKAQARAGWMVETTLKQIKQLRQLHQVS